MAQTPEPGTRTLSVRRARRVRLPGPTSAQPPAADKRRLLVATIIALVVAAAVLMTAILPAEYGIDPTGVGALLGLTRLNEAGAQEDDPDNASANPSLLEFTATWPVTSKIHSSPTGTTIENQTDSVPVNVTGANLTRIWANLTWIDDDEAAGEMTQPDVFEVRLVAPDGRQGVIVLGRNEQPGGAGHANATFEWRPAPQPRAIQAIDATTAYFHFLDAIPPDHSAVGTWLINVRLVDAGDAHVGGVPVGGPAADTQEDWTLTVGLETFALDAHHLAMSAVRSDNVSITIQPGRGIEYKLFVNEGDRFNYSWSTGGADVDFDFHGERAGDTSGAFTSHKEGTADSEAGTLLAPFTGTHGWYWENRGQADVIVRLEIQGTYSVVGIR